MRSVGDVQALSGVASRKNLHVTGGRTTRQLEPEHDGVHVAEVQNFVVVAHFGGL
jgi:hypothetical protein